MRKGRSTEAAAARGAATIPRAVEQAAAAPAPVVHARTAESAFRPPHSALCHEAPARSATRNPAFESLRPPRACRRAQSAMRRPRVAITVGDPAGIGPEVAAKAADDSRVLAACEPTIYGPPNGAVFPPG